MKEDLYKVKEINEQIKERLDFVKSNPKIVNKDINIVKSLKHKIYEKSSEIFIYNLKKLIMLEGTQRNLAKKIGVSEDLLSKYKSGEAFPSIETLIYMAELYNFSIDKLINMPLNIWDIENLQNKQEADFNIFEEKYYVYFLVTNIAREGAIHEGIVEFSHNKVQFKILSKGEVVKCFIGSYNISDKLIFFNLESSNEGIAYINMFRPNINKNKYDGGIALLMLPSDANSKPCAQKILFSKTRINREINYENLKELLSFSVNGITLEHVKISQWEDEDAYKFIRKLQEEGVENRQ